MPSSQSSEEAVAAETLNKNEENVYEQNPLQKTMARLMIYLHFLS